MGRERRTEDWHLDDEPTSKPADPGVGVHHLPVGGDVGTSDLVDARSHVHGLAQVGQKVGESERLDPGVDPSGAHHHGESFGEVADHLKGDTPGPEDHRSPELDGGYAGRAEHLSHFLPAGQVFGEVAVPESSEVHDPSHPSPGGGLGERAGQVPVAIGETGAAGHGVDEVVGHPAPRERFGEVGRVVDVDRSDLHAGPGLDGAGVAHEGPDAVARAGQMGGQLPPDESVGPGHSHRARTGGRGGRRPG